MLELGAKKWGINIWSFFLIGLVFSLSAGNILADDKDIVLFDFAKGFNAKYLAAESLTARIVDSGIRKALQLTVRSGEDSPIITFKAPHKSWDLSRKRYVEMDIKNLTDKAAVLTFWALSGAGWGGVNSSCFAPSGRDTLGPNCTRTLKIDIHARYGGPDAYCKAINPVKVTAVEIVFHVPGTDYEFEVLAIRATGTGPSEPHDISKRVKVPEVTSGKPSPGKRVRQSLPDYAGTKMSHVLCLPKDWSRGTLYPIIVEYTGNVFYHKFCHSTGLTDQGNMAYGLARGEGFICINMPFVSEDGLREQKNGWGSPEKTIEYCIKAIRYVCEKYGGDPGAVFITGFSRGQIACNYIALRDERIADVWLAFIGSDPAMKWKEGEGWHKSGIGWDERGTRLKGRECIVEKVNLGPVHVDVQYLEDSPATLAVHERMQQVLKTRPGTHTISGRVTDENGNGMKGVRIESGETHFIFTDETGHYLLKSLIDGERTVTAAKKGYLFEPVQKVTVNGHDVQNINFTASQVQ